MLWTKHEKRPESHSPAVLTAAIKKWVAKEIGVKKKRGFWVIAATDVFGNLVEIKNWKNCIWQSWLLTFNKVWKLRASPSRPCTYGVRKIFSTYKKKSACAFWVSFNFQNPWKIFYRNVLLLLYLIFFCCSLVVLWIQRKYMCSLFWQVRL